MAVELSLFASQPGYRGDDAQPWVTASAVDGGGSRLQDALAIVDSLGPSHPAARALLDRNANAPKADRYFAGDELDVLRALVQDAIREGNSAVDRAGRPLFPQVNPLLRDGVVEDVGDRVVLRRSGHGLGRVVGDLVCVAELLEAARKQHAVVVCDYDEPDE